MPLSEVQVRALARATSVAAAAFQATALKRELERINEHDFPHEACRIRDVFICWPEFILTQLEDIQALEPDGATGPAADRVRLLGLALQRIYSFIRYLTASSARQAPPAVQGALNRLVDVHFPKQNGKPLAVIRPQWTHNLSYMPLSRVLENLIVPAALDPNVTLPALLSDEIPAALWRWRRDRLPQVEQDLLEMDAPKHIAVLSFAGLDTHDALLYPILAHELGHFIDFSFDPALNLSPEINQKTEIAFADVVKVLSAKNSGLLGDANEIWKDTVARVRTCVRELLADMLGLRMMGFGFFAAQTELLKTKAQWPAPEPLVSGSGYPGTQFRFWSLLRQLLTADFPGNIRAFLANNPTPPSLDLGGLDHYLHEWESQVRYSANLQDKPLPVDPLAEADANGALNALAANAVLKGYEAIEDIARQQVDNGRAATLTATFFDRVERLKCDLPPSVPAERRDSFAEIMAAGWAYQLTYGEERERQHPAHAQQFVEYEKTCRLLMKAVELIPDSDLQAPQLQPSVAPESGTVLSKGHIAHRLTLPVADSRHLAVIPTDAESIESASVDVHLGNWFVALRRTRLSRVRLGHDGSETLLSRVGREETFVSGSNTYLIHPGDLILGVTREFLALPADLMAFVEGKSKWGRLGLIVATASQVAPGFHGVIVLELANAGTVPIELRPTTAIAQLVFQKMSEPSTLYRGRFYCQVKP